MWKDSETELDFLDYEYLIRTLQSIIMDDTLLPASIGVYGDWGSGKSSLMYMCKKRLEDSDKKIKCLIFNGWLFENYNDAKTAILGSILDEIGKQKRISKKAKDTLKGLYESVDKLKLIKSAVKYGSQFLLSGGMGLLSDIMVDKIARQFQTEGQEVDPESIKNAVSDELQDKELREDIRKFQKEFAKLLSETKISRLVVFIDELDRCRPDTILDTLEAIKLFLFGGKVAFVIGADERHISYAVKSKFKDIEGIQINIGQEYLEKLIQYPIRIPRLSADEVETYIACLLLQNELSNEYFEEFVAKIKEEKSIDFEKYEIKKVGDQFSQKAEIYGKITDALTVARQLATVLSSGLQGNPRQCKRFLNALYMRLQMAEYKNKTLDRMVLAKIMMLEYIKPFLFKEIANLAFNNTLGKELKALEEGKGTDELIALKQWQDDPWFFEWCKIQPVLSDVDLRIYFYFTRTSLDDKISRISSALSPKAQDILDKLLSKTDVKIKAAVDDASSLSDSEAATILEALFTTMSAETKIAKEHFSAFIQFIIQRNELHIDALGYLKSFTGEQIPLSAAARIKAFADAAQKKEEVLEITQQWGKTYPDLENAIESLFT